MQTSVGGQFAQLTKSGTVGVVGGICLFFFSLLGIKKTFIYFFYFFDSVVETGDASLTTPTGFPQNSQQSTSSWLLCIGCLITKTLALLHTHTFPAVQVWCFGSRGQVWDLFDIKEGLCWKSWRSADHCQIGLRCGGVSAVMEQSSEQTTGCGDQGYCHKLLHI